MKYLFALLATLAVSACQIHAAPIELSTATAQQKAAIRTALEVQPAQKNANTCFAVIPTIDNIDSVTHPSIVRYPGGWNGYEYWMAATPYPDAARENPSIWCSHDGVTWVVPSGATNPVLAPGTFNGHAYANFSDPCLIILDKTCGSFTAGTMMLFARPMYGATWKEGIVYTTSTDGVTWTTAVEIYSNNTASYHYISPSVLQESDGSLSLWMVDNAASNTVKKYTSADAVTWTVLASATACTFSNSLVGNVSHIEVRYRDGRYHALIKAESNILAYTESTDGITWIGRDGPNGIFKSQTATWAHTAAAYDHQGFYKSTMLPNAGNPRLWDLWVPCISAVVYNDPVSAADVYTGRQQIRIMRGVELQKPYLNLYKNAGSNQTISSGTYTKVTGMTGVRSTDYWNASTEKFTPPPGTYLFQAHVYASGGSTTGQGTIYVAKNGEMWGVASDYFGVSHQPDFGGSMILEADGDDYFEFNVRFPGTNWAVYDGIITWFQAYRIGY